MGLPSVTLQWITGHAGISGNVEVDKAAKRSHRLPLTNFCLPLGDRLLEVKGAIWSKWCRDRLVALQMTHLGRLRVNNVASASHTMLRNRRVNSAICRLRTGHTQLRSHLFRLNIVDSASCVHCGQPETISHVLFYCPRYYTNRVWFQHRVLSLGLPFVYERVLGSDLDDIGVRTRVYRHLTVYLKNIGMLDHI